MINDIPYGPIRPRDLSSFTYFAGNKFGWLRYIKYECINPEGKPREEHPTDGRPSLWEVYIKSISERKT